MAEEFTNPVVEDAESFETEEDDRGRRAKASRFADNLKGGLGAVKGGVGSLTHGAAEKMGTSNLTSVKDLMKFADLAGACTRVTIARNGLTGS
jgi:hypothetical protein